MHKKAIKLQKNAKKLLIFTDFLVWEELISSWIFKILIYSPPRGRRIRPEYLPLMWVHSVHRGGINSPLRDMFLACFRQEVQGGEPPPCPRVALSWDRRVAFAKNIPHSRLSDGDF